MYETSVEVSHAVLLKIRQNEFSFGSFIKSIDKCTTYQ